VCQSEGAEPFFMYRNTAFHVVAKPEGGFTSEFYDDYSNDSKLAPLNEVTHDTATVEEAIEFWVEKIWAAQNAVAK
jgi:hypothetical protein